MKAAYSSFVTRRDRQRKRFQKNAVARSFVVEAKAIAVGFSIVTDVRDSGVEMFPAQRRCGGAFRFRARDKPACSGFIEKACLMSVSKKFLMLLFVMQAQRD